MSTMTDLQPDDLFLVRTYVLGLGIPPLGPK